MPEPRFELRLCRMGDSLGVILPDAALTLLGVEATDGARLVLAGQEGSSELALRRADAGSDRRLALLRDTILRYANALQALAR